MNLVFLSGGSGKRLWPLSNNVRSKQFIKIFLNPNGEYESMIQRVCRQVKYIDPDVNITIATSKTQVSAIRNQICNKVNISIEPCRRDTFPAIALATAYLHDVEMIDANETVVVCPVDPYVETDYFFKLKEMCLQASKAEANLVLMGIVPTYPSEKYGYIVPHEDSLVSRVKSFTEKPTKEKATEYIAQGALWNGGVFAYKLSYVLNIAERVFGTSTYEDLYSRYDTLQRISFDYAVVEKEPSIQVMRYSGDWIDVGTWNTLTETMSEKCYGKSEISENCKNVHVLNELDIPIFAMDVENLIIAAGPDGILVSDKERSSYIKPYVDKIDQQVMFAEKSWGSYQVIDVEKKGLVVKINIKSGDSMNYHSHDKRDEVWIVVSGSGKAYVDGMEKRIKSGDVITMAAGCKHMVTAETELEMIEVQLGENISVKDKHKYTIEA